MEREGPQNGQNVIWGKNTEITGCPKNAKMSQGVKPHLFWNEVHLSVNANRKDDILGSVCTQKTQELD